MWQSYSCADGSSSLSSQRLCPPQYLRRAYVAFFSGCILADRLTGYCVWLFKKENKRGLGLVPCLFVLLQLSAPCFCQLSSPDVSFCNTNHCPRITQRTTSLFPPLPWNNRLRKNIADNQAIFFLFFFARIGFSCEVSVIMWFWLAHREHAKRSASLAILGPMQEVAKIQEENK